MASAVENGLEIAQHHPIAVAAKRLGFSRAFMYKLMDKGEIPYLRVGSARRISEEALAAFVMENTVTKA